MKTKEYTLHTEREGLYDVTAQVREAVRESGVRSGADVRHDLLLGLREAFPDRRAFRHAEGNSAAHLKSSCVGASQLVLVEDGRLLLGTWQGVYFCEFDGPRTRRFQVKVLGESAVG